MRRLFVYFGIRQFLEKPIRSGLIVLGVAFGIALYVAIDIINQSTLASFKDSIEAVAGTAKLSISQGETGFPEDTIKAVQNVPGVRAAVPLIEARGNFINPIDKSSETLMIMGIDLLKEQSVRTYQTSDGQVISDPLLFLNQPDSIIITETFAKEHGLKEDDKFDLVTAHGVRSFTVRGLLTAAGPALAYGGAIAIMDIDGARMSFGKEAKLDRIDVIAKDNQDVKELMASLKKKLGSGYNVNGPDGQMDVMAKMISSYQYLLTMFSSLALLAGLFLIANCVSISISERRKEIGTLRALGCKRLGILILFLLESLFYGVIGSLFGAFLGRGLASILLKRVQEALADQYQIPIEISKLNFGVKEVVVALILGTITSLIAALYPSIQAMRISPLEAIRQSADDAEGKPKGFMRFTPRIGAVMLLFYAVSSVLQLSKFSIAVEILNQTFAMVGSAFVAPAIVNFLISACRPLVTRMGAVIPTLSAGNLLRNPTKTAGNVMTLMVGLIFVVNIAAINVSFRNTIVSWFNVILRADLIVSSGSLLSNQVQPLHEDLVKELNAVPGVGVDQGSGVFASRSAKFTYEGEVLNLSAFDEPAASIHYGIFDMSDGDLEKTGKELFHSDTPVIFVSQNFVVHFKKKIGDLVEIPTPRGSVPMKIIAVIVDWASPVGAISMSRDQYKKYWNDPLVNSFNVYVKPGFDAALVRKDIDSRLGMTYKLNVVLASEFRKQMGQAVDRSFSYTQTIQTAALLVGLLGLLNALLVSVMERTRELGMLRAIGMQGQQVRRMIFWEALFLGGFGAMGAAVLGCFISFFWITFSLTRVLGWVVNYSLPIESIVTVIAAGGIVSLIAGAYPAYFATKIEIREALTYE